MPSSYRRPANCPTNPSTEPGERTMRRSFCLLLFAAGLTCGCLPTTAIASDAISLHATLTPERLGQGTTIGFDLDIAAPPGQVPPPLIGVNVRYPNNLGIALSGVGLETCTEATLQLFGAAGCPVDSIMGHGSALASVPIGQEGVSEGASITMLRAPDQEGHLALFFYTESRTPVLAQ